MSAINLVTTSDAYTSAATLITPPTNRLTLIVSNAAVFYSLRLTYAGTRESDNDWKEDRNLVPGLWTFGEADFKGAICTGIRLRSGVAGVPAVISASD